MNDADAKKLYEELQTVHQGQAEVTAVLNQFMGDMARLQKILIPMSNAGGPKVVTPGNMPSSVSRDILIEMVRKAFLIGAGATMQATVGDFAAMEEIQTNGIPLSVGAIPETNGMFQAPLRGC